MAVAAFSAPTGVLASLRMSQDTVGDRVTLALRRSGLEDYEVAERANVTPQWLSAVKNDRIKNPPLDKLLAVAKVCGVPGRFLTEPMGIIPIAELRDNDWEAGLLADPRYSQATKDAVLTLLRPHLEQSSPEKSPQ